MIHARDDYNRIQDPAGLIGEDEPVFLIRATDRVSGNAVRAWADLHEAAGGDAEIANLARAHAERMDAWPKKKEADLPTDEDRRRMASPEAQALWRKRGLF